MPTIVIKNGSRTLKFTKHERDVLMNASVICGDLMRDFPPLADEAATASNLLSLIYNFAAPPAVAKPKEQPAK